MVPHVASRLSLNTMNAAATTSTATTGPRTVNWRTTRTAGRVCGGFHRLHVFQPEHAADQEPGEGMEAFGDQQQPAIGRTHRLLRPHEGGEVHDAREHPADVCQAQIPGLGKGNAGEL